MSADCKKKHCGMSRKVPSEPVAFTDRLKDSKDWTEELDGSARERQ